MSPVVLIVKDRQNGLGFVVVVQYSYQVHMEQATMAAPLSYSHSFKLSWDDMYREMG